MIDLNNTTKTGNKYAVTDWDGYIGQEAAKKLIRLKINAAKERHDQMDHLMILGEAGTGKSNLARLIAEEHGLRMLDLEMAPSTSMEHIMRQIIEFDYDQEIYPEGEEGEGVDPITIPGGGIVFIDEIHQLSKKNQHHLYSALQDGFITHNNGKKYFFQNKMTFIGATTDENMLTSSLRGRFGPPIRLESYSDIEMAQIVERMFLCVDIQPTEKMCIVLGRASSGSPRQASGLVNLARDLMATNPNIDPFDVLKEAGVTPEGLTPDHVAYLSSLRKLGGRAGVDNIAAHSMRAKSDVIDMEKILVSRGYIEIGGRGRNITRTGELILRRLDKERA